MFSVAMVTLVEVHPVHDAHSVDVVTDVRRACVVIKLILPQRTTANVQSLALTLVYQNLQHI